MHARVTFATLKPTKIEEGIKVTRDSILPAAKQQKGFRNMFLLVNRNANNGMMIALWDTEADMMAGESSEFCREQVAKMAPLVTELPTMEHYEVAVQG